MKSTTNIFIFLVSLFAIGCVNRIDVPQEDNLKMVVEMEMLRGDEITAQIYSSSNLKGNFSIRYPMDAEVKVFQTNNFENLVVLQYDEDRELYYAVVNSNEFLRPGLNYSLTADLDDETISEVKSNTTVPRINGIDSVEVLYERAVNISGEELWEAQLRISLKDLNLNTPAYYQIILNETFTEIIDPIEKKYSYDLSKKTPFEILSIDSGYEAFLTFDHKTGLFLDEDKLEQDYFDLTIRSTIAQSSTSQVRDLIFPNIVSITKEHFDYHLGLDNIQKSEESIFGEPALYRTNIVNGLGVFSSCVETNEVINIFE